MASPKTTGRRRNAAETRSRIVAATRKLLITDGFAQTTTRAIATAADCNQGLISYYFGGLNPLLLEVLDGSSRERLDAYRTRLSAVRGLRAVRTAGRDLHREDWESGHTKILAELVTGGLTDRTLGREVAMRIEPWIDVAELAVVQAVPAVARRRLPVREAAYAIAALFVGLEMLSSLSDDRGRSHEVIDRLASKWLGR